MLPPSFLRCPLRNALGVATLTACTACATPSGTSTASTNSSNGQTGATSTSGTGSSKGSSIVSGTSSGTTQGSGSSSVTTGASGASSTGSGSSTQSGSGACTPVFSDGFEAYGAGGPPDQSVWHSLLGSGQSYLQIDAGPSSGGLYIQIDSSQHHAGTNALRVTQGDGNGYYAVNTSAFSKLGQQVYARFYARFSGGSGTVDGGFATTGHNGFLSMHSGYPPNTDPNFWTDYANEPSGHVGGELRIGVQGNALDWNNWISSADGTLPDINSTGAAQSINPPANAWNCYEFHVDQSTGYLEFWYNGASVSGLSWSGPTDPGIAAGVKTDWAQKGPAVPLSLQSFGLGWLNLGVSETVWYDDVALANCRIGCP